MARLAFAGDEVAGDWNTSHRPRPDGFPTWAEKALPKMLFGLAAKGDTFLAHGWGPGKPAGMFWLNAKRELIVPIEGVETPHAALRNDGQGVIVFDFLGARATEWTPDGKTRDVLAAKLMWGVGYTRKGLVASVGKKLQLYARVGEPKPVATADLARGGSLVTVFGGDAVVVAEEKALRVFDARGGKLVEIGAVKMKAPHSLTQLGDRVFFVREDDHAYRELTGLGAAFAKA